MSVESEDLLHLTPEQQEEIRQGRLFLHHFFSILRGALYHQTNNVALEEPSKAFADQLAWVVSHEAGKVTFVVGHGQIFLGSMRVRPHARQQQIVKDLERFLNQRGLGGLIFNGNLDAQQCRTLAQTLVAFSRPAKGQDAVALFAKELEGIKMGHLVAPHAIVRAKVIEGSGRLTFKTEVGQLVQQFAKGFAVLSDPSLARSPGGRGVVRHTVREMAEAHREAMDAMIGVAMLAACQDFAMRSLTIVVVAMAVADQFGATKEQLAEIGQVAAELAHADEAALGRAKRYGRPMAGVADLEGLLAQKRWPVPTIRQHLGVAGRYLSPGGGGQGDGLPSATRAAEIIRIAADWVDLVTPTPMAKTEPLFADTPMAPHEALLNLRDQVGARFSQEVYAALVSGVGLLPPGTAVVLSSGDGVIITKRTTDPLTFFAKDSRTLRDCEAAFMPGPNEIVKVVVGAELLDVRARALIGPDYETLMRVKEESGVVVA